MDFEEDTAGPRLVPGAAETKPSAAGTLPSAQMAAIRAMQDKFFRAFAEELTRQFETPVSAQCAEVQTDSSSAFLQSTGDGGCVLTLDAEPVRGQAFAALSPGLVTHLLGALLGAAPNPEEAPRAVTEIELHLLRDTFEWIARELSAAWQPAGIGFRWTATGVGEAVPVPGALLVFDCRMDLGEVSATLGIAVPAFLARLAALQCAAAPPADGPAPARGSILSALRRAHATVEAVLCGSTLRMGDLLAMEPGHVLMLAQPAGSALECRVNGKTKFQGEWIGRGDGRQGLELL